MVKIYEICSHNWRASTNVFHFEMNQFLFYQINLPFDFRARDAARKIMQGLGQNTQPDPSRAAQNTGQNTPVNAVPSGQGQTTSATSTAPKASDTSATTTQSAQTAGASTQAAGANMHPYSFHSLPGSGILTVPSAQAIDLSK